MIAKNRCHECGHDWQDRPMGFAIHQACPNCASLYWEWRNYDEACEPRRHTPSVSLAGDEDP
ncbi:MAG TPA: hypothetical protein VFY03_13030 [Woeseiaceae bacterium]|nr:hypothetical protein [Woeseiaceae bacterium]